MRQKNVDLEGEARRLAREYRLSLEDAWLVMNMFAWEDIRKHTAAGRRLQAKRDPAQWDMRPCIEQLTEEYPQFATPEGQATLRRLQRLLSSVDD